MDAINFVRQPVLEKENSEYTFKLKIDLLSHSGCGGDLTDFNGRSTCLEIFSA